MPRPRLSILIATLTERKPLLDRLLAVLDPQCDPQQVELLFFEDQGQATLGAKRQSLLERAKGEYVCVVDDDDLVSDDYIQQIFSALDSTPGATHCSLRGLMQTEGVPDVAFEHSTRHTAWAFVDGIHVRPPNHLNTIRWDLAILAGYPTAAWAEDYTFSMRLRDMGLLTNEAWVEPTIYHYFYNAKAPTIAILNCDETGSIAMNNRGYSQYGEEAFILAYFSRQAPGRFLDIGAYDGETFSNTKALTDRGWHGVLVEPDPYAFTGLVNRYKQVPESILVNAALSLKPGLMQFYTTHGDAISTSDDRHRQAWTKAGSTFTPIYVQGMTAEDLLAAFPGPYEFVNLDVEACNWDLLQRLPLETLGTRLLCVEHDGHQNEIRAWAATKGLSCQIHLNGTNLLVGRP
jgi:FkbM family methyltransferase